MTLDLSLPSPQKKRSRLHLQILSRFLGCEPFGLWKHAHRLFRRALIGNVSIVLERGGRGMPAQARFGIRSRLNCETAPMRAVGSTPSCELMK